ncbi:MAG: hypothetical protein FWE04_04900 [Oscillospiraceae bacterium]|nr:hypothetical protein [Oscillospiraceae bacterium]
MYEDMGQIQQIIEIIASNPAMQAVSLYQTYSSLYDGVLGIKECFVAKKFQKFEESLRNNTICPELIEKWKNSSEEKRYLIAERIIIAIDRVDKENKAELIGKLFLALIEEKINYTLFDDMLKIIENWFDSDADTLRGIEKLSQRDKWVGGENVQVEVVREQRLKSIGLVDEGLNDLKSNLDKISKNEPIKQTKRLSIYGLMMLELIDSDKISKNYCDKMLGSMYIHHFSKTTISLDAESV